MNLDDMTREGRISDSVLATEVPLQPDEKVLTSADYYLVSRTLSWLRGTLYLTSHRLIWIRWNAAWILFNRGRTYMTIRLSDVKQCQTRWSPWRPLGRAMLVIEAQGEPHVVRLMPVHFTTDTKSWAEAVNGLRRGASVAE